VVAGSVYPQTCRFSKTFLLQEFVQVATSGAENRPAWPTLAEAQNVLSTNHLTQLSAQFLGDVGRIQLWTRRLGLRRREVSLHKK